MNGTTSIDYIEGSEGVDTIRSYIQDDYVLGWGGDDIIETNAGADLIIAGDGDDYIDAGDDGDLIDGGTGFDVVIFAASNIGVRADLESRVGQGGFAQGDTYIGIEAFIGTGFADILGGDAANNRLEGEGGNDLLEGRDGSDELYGGAGNDKLHGDEGGDQIDGGEGSDTANYFDINGNAIQGVSISLAAGTASGGDAEGDTLLSIENLVGSDFSDTLIGDAGANRIEGGRGDDLIDGGEGDDILIGGRGADSISGGSGVDTVAYSLSVEGLDIDLANNLASSGDAQGDVLTGIEIVEASYHDDNIFGDSSDNRLRGGRGADHIDGRGGFDIADYSTAEEGVSVDLTLGTGTAGEALGDTLAGIEMLLGSSYIDQLVGSAGNDWFDGGFGNDTVFGASGSDTYLFGFDSSADIITDIGDSADVDRISFKSPLLPKDISLIRLGDDLFVELERDDGYLIDTVLIKDHFLGNSTGIEEIVFTNGIVWDRAKIETLVRVGRFNALDDIFRFGVEDQIAVIDPATLIINDAAEGVSELQLISVQNPRFGTVRIREDGMIEFLGAQDHFGDAFFDYTVRDPYGRESTARVEVNLSPVNDAPVAVDDDLIYAVEDQILRIRIENLLANDYDVDGDREFEQLRIISLEPLVNEAGDALYPYASAEHPGPATHLAWKIDGDYLELEPRGDYFGFAGFTYTIADRAGATAKASVEVYIAPVNDAPRLNNPVHSVRLETTVTITVAQLMQHVYDIEQDSFSFAGMHYATDGRATNNGEAIFDGAAQTVTYTPGALGDAVITFNVIDALGAAATVRYKLRVRPLNDAPIARNDYGFRTLEDQILVIDPATLLANDTDENGDTLILTGVQRFPDWGKVRINDAGMIEFSPRADYNGAAGFEYYISDGRGGTAKAYVSITVMPRNDGPVLRNDIVSGLEDRPLYVIPAEAFGNDLDAQGDVLFFKRSTVLGPLEHKFIAPNFTVEAKLDNNRELPDWLSFDAELMQFSGIAPVGDTDPVKVAIFLRDPTNGATYAHRFTLGIGALAEGVALSDDVMEDYQIRQNFAADFEFGANDIAPDTLVTATLADGSPLPSWLVFDPETLGFIGIAPEGLTEAFEAELRFERLDVNGQPVSFVDRVMIDPATITSGTVYDSDIALFDMSAGTFSATVNGGRPLPDWLLFETSTMQLSASGFEPDADAPMARVQIVFTPEPLTLPGGTFQSSRQGFTLEFVIDPQQPLQPALEAINALLSNDPFFASQGLFMLELAEASSLDADRESGIALPSWLAFDAEKLTFEGMPPSNFVGAVPIRIDVGGNGSSLPAMSVITDVDVDFTFTLSGDGAGLNWSTAPERINLFAPEDFNGTVAIRYDATDEKGGVSINPAYILFNVTPQAELPDAYLDRIDTVENGQITISISQLLDNDRDDDGDPLRVTALGPVGNGALTLNLASVTISPPVGLIGGEGAVWSATLDGGAALPVWLVMDASTGVITATVPLALVETLDIMVSVTIDGSTTSEMLSQSFNGNDGASLTYQGNLSFSGVDSFTYTVTDDRQGSVTGRANIHVAPLFDPPTANRDTLLAIEDTPLVILPTTLLANDIDVDGDPIRLIGVLNPEHGTVSFDGGQIIFTPDHNFSGQARFEYQITDDVNGSSVGLVLLNVRSTNLAPIAATDIFDAIEDTPYEFTPADLLANDSDPDGDEFRFVSLSTSHKDGKIVQLPDGRWQFVPDENVTGPISFSYVITDGRLSKTGTFTFDIAPVNDAPIANADGIRTGNNPAGLFVGEQDTPLVISISDLIVNDRDVEGDAFSLVEIFDGDNGNVVQVGDTAVFTPREGYYGNAAFHYRVTDIHGDFERRDRLFDYHARIRTSDRCI